MKNKWKVGFFLLLGLILAGIIIITAMVFMPIEDDALPKTAKIPTRK